MAKRKKPGDGKSAPDNVTPFPGPSESAPKDFLREKEQMMSLISKKLESSDMSFEEAETFLSGFTGRNMEDVIEALEYIQRVGPLWVAIPIPFMLLGTFGTAIRPRKSRSRREIEELEDIVAAADIPGLTPWWEEILEDIKD